MWQVTGDRFKRDPRGGRRRPRVRLAADRRRAVRCSRRATTFNGLYTAVLGWILGSQARGAAVQTAFTERLEGVTVADIMDPDPVAIPADVPVLTAYEDFFLRYHGYDWFAVTERDGGYVGRAYRIPVMEAAEGPASAGAGARDDALRQRRPRARRRAARGAAEQRAAAPARRADGRRRARPAARRRHRRAGGAGAADAAGPRRLTRRARARTPGCARSDLSGPPVIAARDSARGQPADRVRQRVEVVLGQAGGGARLARAPLDDLVDDRRQDRDPQPGRARPAAAARARSRP